MFRQVFTPTEKNSSIPPVTIPQEWYGQEVEIIIFPIGHENRNNTDNRENRLLNLCGAWKSEKSAEEIIADIYKSRNSGKTHILEEL